MVYLCNHFKLQTSNFKLQTIALLDRGTDLNCIKEGLIPFKYFEKTIEKMTSATGSKLQIKYNLPMLIFAIKNIVSKMFSYLSKFSNKKSFLELLSLLRFILLLLNPMKFI